MVYMTRIAIIGAGPGGYEAALVGAQLGAEVTIIERDGIGGSAVLTDCVPSKSLVATAVAMNEIKDASHLGISAEHPSFSLRDVNRRIMELASAQSADIKSGLQANGVHILPGHARFISDHEIEVTNNSGTHIVEADVILIATGARPRILDSAQSDGERILTWEQIYGLKDLPQDLIVIGSGVTGAEFASAYLSLGSRVTLVSSRDHVLPGQDVDAAEVIETVFNRSGGVVKARSRAIAVKREGESVVVALESGEALRGSHVLLAVGSLPNTDQLDVENAGVKLDDRGFIDVDRVSRTNVPHVYAAGDCTGVLMLASVAAMQGRIAMWHALGEAVKPLNLESVSATVFTQPEIATVGDVSGGEFILLPLDTNARAKMEHIDDGFIKIFARASVIVGAVICSPRASELIHPITVAITGRLTVDQFAQTFTVYPSLSGSLAEAARRLHQSED